MQKTETKPAHEGGIKRHRDEGEEKGKAEEPHHKSQKIDEHDTPTKINEEEKIKEKVKDVPPMSEPREEDDFHEEVQSLEKGHIFFFYRPKVGLEHAKNFDEVQRTYIIFYPDGKDVNSRLMIMPKKKLPDVHKKSDRVLTFVDIVGNIDALVSALKETEYVVGRGKRKQAGARLLARGVYLMANHKEPKSKRTFSNHVHLAYALTHPSEPHPLQKSFHIYDEGDFILEEPPKEMKALFTGHKFIPANPPEMMDFRGAEVVFIAAHHYPAELEQYGEKLEATAEREKHRVSLKKVKDELHLTKNDPTMSLNPLQGKWD